MKIKNIRQYRSEYKVKSRGLGKTRDEHFVGTFYHDDQDNKKYGWFDIYHGDKEGYDRIEEGIGNFLQSFLDMAKDGQAVYEFLQNAVDAGSSHFSMFWGEDEIDGNQYALIANNGAMFGFDNVRSILNVGSSTKSSNSHTIGKFGIGFKLAHRLVGKENGLDELLANYSGPILFSWKNNEIEQLAAAEDIEPVDVRLTKRVDNPREYEIKDDNPWLFKILLTCFPCLPENDFVTDEIRLLEEEGTASDIFNKQEYEVFCRWVRKYSDILKANDYREGSLIFIKLGAGKEADLADQNLASGIKFSLAVLEKTADKTSGADSVLKTVQLNRDHVIEYPELNYLPFYISREGEDRNDYVYIRFGLDSDAELTEEQLKILEKETDIEVLFGFRDFDKIDDYFKGAPNFYLYFPLSEEVHNFNFILHSNAFYKASSRTFLHKGTGTDYGINERLLSKITERVDKELYRLYEVKDSNFIHLYVSLLTSGCSMNQERDWIKEPFIDKIEAILMKYIPVKSEDGLGYEIREKSGAIYIKGTKVDVPLDREVYWFYFEQEEITWEAKEKLRLKVFDIFQLLDIPGIYTSINEWIGTDPGKIGLILQELDQGFWAKPSETQKINLLNLRLFSFSDGRFASALEVGQIQEEGYLVAYNKISEVANVVRKGGLHVTSIDFNRYNFVPKIMSYLSNTHQLKNHDKTVEVFSRCVNEEVLGTLPAGEKLAVFRALRDLNDERKHDRISNLKLLKNRAGEYVPFKSLLKKAPAGWLKKYEVAEGESHPDYASYLLDDEAKYYERIIYPYWQDILGDLITSQEDVRWKMKREIRELYDRCDYEDKRQLLLKNQDFIPYLGTVIKTSDVFYHNEPDKIYVEQYEGIQQLVEKLSGVYIPDYFYLDFIDEDPFELEKVEVGLPEEMTLSGMEAQQLFIFLHAGEEKIFEEYVITENETGEVELRERNYDEYVYYTESGPVKEYIETYHAGNFFLCPEKYKEFTGLGVITKELLFNQLIELLDEWDEGQRIDLLGILPHSEELQKILFEKIDSFVLDVAWKKEKENKAYLKYLSALICNDIIEDGEVQDKIEFRKGNATIYLKGIDTADDEIELVIGEDQKCALSKTKLLHLTDEVGITDIRMFAAEAVRRDCITKRPVSSCLNYGKQKLMLN
ncbi:MAG: ATP-binding protein [Tannerellaceae bacterium]|nr:ATP-binding protein [Tannerellaceae bacterium]